MGNPAAAQLSSSSFFVRTNSSTTSESTSVLFLSLASSAAIRNRHMLDEVFAQDSHFLLRGKMSAGLFHGDPFGCPTRPRHFQFRLKLYICDQAS